MAQTVSPPPDGAYSDVGGAAPEVAQRYDFNGDGHPDYVLSAGRVFVRPCYLVFE